MELELVPIDGEKVLTKEEKEWHEKRIRPISPDLLRQFEGDAEDLIKKFLVKFIILTLQYHTDMEDHEGCSEKQQDFYEQESQRLNKERLAMFENASPLLKEFINILNLFPMESWEEFENLIKNLKSKDLHMHRNLSHNSGISAALDNPFLMQVEDDSEEKHMELEMQSRKSTPAEIEKLVMHYSLREIVDEIIIVRKVGSGNFWKESFYDL